MGVPRRRVGFGWSARATKKRRGAAVDPGVAGLVQTCLLAEPPNRKSRRYYGKPATQPAVLTGSMTMTAAELG